MLDCFQRMRRSVSIVSFGEAILIVFSGCGAASISLPDSPVADRSSRGSCVGATRAQTDPQKRLILCLVLMLKQRQCGNQPQRWCSGRNKNVLIKKVNAGLVQPGWVQRHQGRCPELPSGTPGRLEGTRREDTWARPNKTSRNLRNKFPWRGLERKSASICSV